MAYKVWVTVSGERYWVKKFINIAGVLEIHFTQDVTENHIPEAIEGGMLEIPAKIIEKKVDKNPKVCYNRHINKE